jgi:hypothetical protein
MKRRKWPQGSSHERTMPPSKATGNNRPLAEITRSILVIRGHNVLLDARLAALYGVPTKRLNEQEVRETVANFASDRIQKRSPYAAFTAGTTAAALTIGDALDGRDLEPDAGALFDYMWASQGADGAWVIRHELTLLTTDADFMLAARHCPLRIWSPAP